MDDWEAMLSEPPVAGVQDHNFLPWIMYDVEDASSAASAGGLPLHQIPQSSVELSGGGNGVGLPFDDPASTTLPHPSPFLSIGGGFNQKAQSFGHGNSNLALPPVESLPSPLFLQTQASPNPSFFYPLPQFTTTYQENLPLRPPPPKRQAVAPFPDSGDTAELFLRRNHPQQDQQHNAAAFSFQPKPQVRPKLDACGDEATQQQQQALVDQLLKASELVEAGNSVMALEILARLNHHFQSPVGKPLCRSAFYCKEALQLLATNTHPLLPLASPLDVVLKLGAYKTFSDVSPICQFTNFTCVQVLLEELDNADRIHVIDFDLGVGGQWSSFMQELAQRNCSATTASPVLKITAFTTNSSHHPFELNLTCENLRQFAEDLNILFELNVLNFDHSLLPSMLVEKDEAVVVKLPLGSGSHPPVPALLRFVKQLSPKIVVSVEWGSDRSDLSFAYHFFHAFQSCTVLLDSIDAAGTSQDAGRKIERFLVQPWVENSVLGRYYAGERMLPWRTVFISAGFAPIQFSNFTESQAECLLKRVQVRGFHVDKRQASLSLCWQQRELVSVSAWKC